jgi:hypothetical protein
MLRAEDVKRCTPVSCSLVSLALSADTTSRNLTSCSSDEWIRAIDLHLKKDIYILNGQLGLIHTLFFKNRPYLSRSIELRIDPSRGLWSQYPFRVSLANGHDPLTLEPPILRH